MRATVRGAARARLDAGARRRDGAARAGAASGSTANGCRCTSRRSRARWSRRWPARCRDAQAAVLRLLLRPARHRPRCSTAWATARGMLDPILHNTVSPTVRRLRRQVQRDPGRGASWCSTAACCRASPREHLLGELRALLGDDVEPRGRAARPRAGRARPRRCSATLAAILEQADPGSTAIPLLMPGVSDARFFARLGIQTYGFTPMKLPAGLRLLVGRARRRRAHPRRRSRVRRERDRTRRCAASERPRERDRATRWALTLPFTPCRCASTARCSRARRRSATTTCGAARPPGPDGFTPLALAAAWTERMRLGTGVVNAFTRGPAVLAQHAAALQDASGGRFCLGIGSSSNVIVERWNQIPFEKPLTKVRETVEVLRAVLGGRARARAASSSRAAPDPPPPIYIAALRGRMLRLGGALGDGTFVNFLPLSGVEQVIGRDPRRASARPASRRAPRTCCAASSASRSRRRRRCRSRAGCSPRTRPCPSTRQFFRWLGWGEAIDPMVEAWRAGRPRAGARGGAGGPDPRDLHLRLAGRAEGSGSREFVAARHHDAGADADLRARTSCRR